MSTLCRMLRELTYSIWFFHIIFIISVFDLSFLCSLWYIWAPLSLSLSFKFTYESDNNISELLSNARRIEEIYIYKFNGCESLKKQLNGIYRSKCLNTSIRRDNKDSQHFIDRLVISAYHNKNLLYPC